MSKQVYLSPSALNVFNDCPRCFWLDKNKRMKQPRGIFPSLPSGMDKVLKAIRKDKKNDTADRNTIAAPVYTDSAAADVIKADEEAIETN